jgi:hypothetical protein
LSSDDGGTAEDVIDHEGSMDKSGCLMFFLRFLTCSSLLYIIMFLAIFVMALVGKLFF